MQLITEELIQEIKNCAVKGVHPEKIILFGSCAYRTPTKESNLDLLVIILSNEPMRKNVLQIRKLLCNFRIPKDAAKAFIKSITKSGKVICG